MKVRLQKGNFGDLNPKSWSVENLPTGVSLGSVERLDDKTVQLRLKGNSANRTSKAEIVDLTVIAEKGEVTDSEALLIATRGVVLSVVR